MRNAYYFFLVVVALALVSVFWIYARNIISKTATPVACTMEAKLCSDGSFVVRTGPDCRFAECPVSTTPSSTLIVPGYATDTVTIASGQTGELNGVEITVNSIGADSRCPVDVKCVWAGTLVVSVTLTDSARAEIRNLILNKPPYVFNGHQISIIAVTPERESTKDVKQDEYRITFRVVK